ncbi:MAG: hypothetical protein KGO49_11865 [Gammaproteobacteria bacterium]|nr:hypothetical protein [Gammaproteobacteria bacterium]
MSSTVSVRVIKFDVNSPTDKALHRMQQRLAAQTYVEAMRRCITIADTVTQLSSEGLLYLKGADGQFHQLIIS